MLVRYVILAAALISLLTCPAYADTVVLKDGDRIKGLILDEFTDRIVVSTVDGEKTFMKEDIRWASFDEEVSSLVQKARNHEKKQRYFKAYQLYRKAAEMDPDHELARHRMDRMRNYLEIKTRDDIIDRIRDNNEKRNNAPGINIRDELRDQLGLVLEKGEKFPRIKEVRDNIICAHGVLPLPGDRIVSVWGRMTAYMSTEEAAEELLSSGEVKFKIERTVRVKLDGDRSILDGLIFPVYREAIGAHLDLRKKGLVVTRVFPEGPFARGGIVEEDIIYRLDGKNLRYTPFREVADYLETNRSREVVLVIRRDILAWKNDHAR